MNSRNVIWTLLIGAISALTGGAEAKDNPHAQPVNSPSQKSRAEVMADLQIYVESGLAAVERSETYGYNQEAITRAEARYQELRRSSHYAALIRRFGGTPREEITSR